jgi:hypothetical protein
MIRPRNVWDWIELVVNLATIYGLVSSLYWLYVFMTSPAEILIGPKVMTISGIPFSYVVTSLFSMALGGAYRSIKILVHDLTKNQ